MVCRSPQWCDLLLLAGGAEESQAEDTGSAKFIYLFIHSFIHSFVKSVSAEESQAADTGSEQDNHYIV